MAYCFALIVVQRRRRRRREGLYHFQSVIHPLALFSAHGLPHALACCFPLLTVQKRRRKGARKWEGREGRESKN